MPRGRAPFIAGLLLALGLGLVTWLEPWYQSWSGSRTGSANLLSVALGDSRRLFAKHFYVKADAYFHSGYYPSIFDQRPDEDKLHMAANAGSGNHHEDLPPRGQPNDWIERFGRHFHPSVHTHLGEAKCNDPHQPMATSMVPIANTMTTGTFTVLSANTVPRIMTIMTEQRSPPANSASYCRG